MPDRSFSILEGRSGACCVHNPPGSHNGYKQTCTLPIYDLTSYRSQSSFSTSSLPLRRARHHTPRSGETRQLAACLRTYFDRRAAQERGDPACRRSAAAPQRQHFAPGECGGCTKATPRIAPPLSSIQNGVFLRLSWPFARARGSSRASRRRLVCSASSLSRGVHAGRAATTRQRARKQRAKSLASWSRARRQGLVLRRRARVLPGG